MYHSRVVAVINDWQGYLSSVADCALLPLETQASLVRGFEQPRSEFAMNVNCETDMRLVSGSGVAMIAILLCALCVSVVLDHEAGSATAGAARLWLKRKRWRRATNGRKSTIGTIGRLLRPASIVRLAAAMIMSI